jgi:hypothetical protein
VSDVEDDYEDYRSVRESEGGPHPNRSDPSRGLLVAGLAAVGLLVSGVALLLLVG